MEFIKSIFGAAFLALFMACNQEVSLNKSNDIDNPASEGYVSSTVTNNNAPKNAYFGDLHVHTSWSFDAFIYNVRTTPDDAYRYAKGEAIEHYGSKKVQISKPLDFLAVSDHSEYMGILMQMQDPENKLYNFPLAENIRSLDKGTSLRAFGIIGQSLSRNERIDELAEEDLLKSVWDKEVEAADEHYEPGKFTTFPAYEWTSSPSTPDAPIPYASNLHRNVIYRNSNVSNIPFSSFDSQNPEDLWRWMDKERKKGIDLIAIPHNANMSNGLMYALTKYQGGDLDSDYAKARMRNEPINEVVQLKGQSMSSPMINTNDEFASFENYEYLFTTSELVEGDPKNSYVREAYVNGLSLQNEMGENPFQFGIIGSSDGHNSAAGFKESNHFGKFGNRDNTAAVRLGTDQKFLRSKGMGSGGLAGVWAEENNRDAIFNAMLRKETFATSGPRIQVRFFAGEEIDDNIFEDKDWSKNVYKTGKSMGSTITGASQKPSFIIWAAKDPDDANLDRIQIIKQWVDKSGEQKEKIINVVWSDERVLDQDGNLSAIKNTVDIPNASYTNDVGNVTLQTVWADDEFDPEVHCLYFLRVLQIPTPRWSTYDAKELGIAPPEDLDATIQERAWSSPIWFNPK